MYAQTAVKQNPLLRNGAYGIVTEQKLPSVKLYHNRHGNRPCLW